MLAIAEYLDQIEHKIKVLVQKMVFLKKENADMMEELIKLREELKKSKEKIAQLESQLEQSKKAVTEQKLSDKIDSDKVKEEIELYIQEIDKCLSWLQSTEI